MKDVSEKAMQLGAMLSAGEANESLRNLISNDSTVLGCETVAQF